ncbi:MAG: hybrid sensor histidine kinase/response regulator [Bacteroidales bacterium]|jgi:two-component system sensor histidine kinase/response regulator|nr:hybrid sensor histidine kinase/response regulator [Bacteroidales bacterium]
MNNKRLILIVDDSPNNQRIIGSILSDNKYQLAYAAGGKEALDFVEKQIPDLILLDIMMPVIDGFVVKAKLNENPLYKEIPVIFITALEEPENKAKGFELGGRDYLVKPINKLEVLARVKSQLLIQDQKSELVKINNELQIANDTREKIFSVISHDLRTSIGNMRNVFRFMLDGMVDPVEDRDIIFDAEVTSRHTFNLLENLLYWAKSQQGNIKIYRENVDVDDAVNEVFDQEIGSATNKSIKLTKKIEKGLKLFGDRITLNIILRNLLINAIKFTPEEGDVEIIAKEINDGISIAIKDNGVGMSASDIEKILQKTEAFSKKGTNQERGTGLGLVIAGEFLELNNARIEITSKIDQGSEFTVIFPKADNTVESKGF